MNLVTGATGIIGSHVVLQLLLEGKQVVGAKQKNSDTSRVKKVFDWYEPQGELFQRIKWIEIDILDIFSIEDALEGVTAVYHCAGLVSFDPRDRKKLSLVNEQGTRNLVNVCLHKKIEAFCHVSTIGTINNSDYPYTLTENVFWKTSGKESDYAVSKYNAEREVWRGMEEGLNVVIVNPGVVLSPVFWNQSSSRIFEQCYRGNRFYTDGQSAYVAARDVARVMTGLMNKTLYSQRYIVIENNYRFREIFDLMHDCLKKPRPAIRVGARTLRVVGYLQRFFAFFTGKPPLLTKSLINAALNRQSFSNEKVKNVLGIEFEPVANTIGKICDFYLEEHEKTQASL
jgi:dihydroflavonol-4-reductase